MPEFFYVSADEQPKITFTDLENGHIVLQISAHNGGSLFYLTLDWKDEREAAIAVLSDLENTLARIRQRLKGGAYQTDVSDMASTSQRD